MNLHASIPIVFLSEQIYTPPRGDAADHFVFLDFFLVVFFLAAGLLAVAPFFFSDAFFFFTAARFVVFLAATFLLPPPNADDQLSEYFSVVPLFKTVTAKSLVGFDTTTWSRTDRALLLCWYRILPSGSRADGAFESSAAWREPRVCQTSACSSQTPPPVKSSPARWPAECDVQSPPTTRR